MTTLGALVCHGKHDKATMFCLLWLVVKLRWMTDLQFLVLLGDDTFMGSPHNYSALTMPALLKIMAACTMCTGLELINTISGMDATQQFIYHGGYKFFHSSDQQLPRRLCEPCWNSLHLQYTKQCGPGSGVSQRSMGDSLCRLSDHPLEWEECSGGV